MEYNEKQLQIMEAAEILFAEKGFNGTSVRDISEKAHVNLAMTSYYFGSKEKLLEAIFEYRGDTMKLQLENLLQLKGQSSLQKMDQLIDHYINKILSQQPFSRIMAREQVMSNTGTTAALILKLKRCNQELVQQLIKEGQQSGEFKQDIDLPMLVATLVGTAHHMISSKHYYKALNNLEDLSDEAFQEHIRKKLSKHLKQLFKTILTHEA